MAEAIENPFGNDADDFHICQLVSRHLWAIGKNLALHDGPPVPDNNSEDNDDEDNEEDGDMDDHVKINLDKTD